MLDIKAWIRFITAIMASGVFASYLSAATMTAKGNKLLIQPGTYGGCAATFSVDPQTVDPGCDRNWLSFDCDGKTRSKSDSNLQWNAFQLAIALDREMFLLFNSNTRINGKCVVKRIDVIPPPL